MPKVYCQKHKCSFNFDQVCYTSGISLIKLNGNKLRCNAYTDKPLHRGVFNTSDTAKKTGETSEPEEDK